MKTASILLALVVVLGFVTEAVGKGLQPSHDCTVIIAGRHLGFQDYQGVDCSLNEFSQGWMHIGPFGRHAVPFTATQGLIGFCCILATLIIVPVVFTVRWKKKRAR